MSAGFRYPAVVHRASLLLAFLLLLSAPARAGVDAALKAQGWREMGFFGRPQNDFFAAANNAIGVRTAATLSMIYRPVRIDLGKTPCLAWEWRVDQSTIPPMDLSKPDTDRPLAVYVAFRVDAERASVAASVRHTFFSAIAGGDAPGEVLMYVWGGVRRRGESLASSRLGDSGFVRILRPSGTEHGKWLAEEVDVAADFRKAFGDPLLPLQQIAISGDSDDSGGHSLGFVRNLHFTACHRHASSPG
jgi:hypothetical protein